MTSEISTVSYIGNLTVEMFKITGWYPTVSEKFIEPSIWGKNKGCDFIRKSSCQFEQFCSNAQQLDCDFMNIGVGKCKQSSYIDNCLTVQLKQDNLCINNKNNIESSMRQIHTGQIFGQYSRCFRGDLTKKGLLNDYYSPTRCYQTKCLENRSILVIEIAQYLFVCQYPGYIITNIPQFHGSVQCPSNFDRICKQKQICPYGCGKKGICINGKCLCIGSNTLTPTCIEQTPQNRLLLEHKKRQIIQKSLECSSGYIFDPVTQRCESCLEILFCSKCDKFGCLQCEDGSSPIDGKC